MHDSQINEVNDKVDSSLKTPLLERRRWLMGGAASLMVLLLWVPIFVLATHEEYFTPISKLLVAVWVIIGIAVFAFQLYLAYWTLLRIFRRKWSSWHNLLMSPWMAFYSMIFVGLILNPTPYLLIILAM